MRERYWETVDELPPAGMWVEVTGESGYYSQPHFLALAQYDPALPLAPWRSVSGDALSECGWEPTHWRHMNLPTVS